MSLLEVSRMLPGDAGDTRSPASSGPKGGQFAPGGGRVAGKGKPHPKRPARKAGPPKPSGPLGWDGKTGAGYGIKGGDARVRTLQSVLNRLGLTDSDGLELAVDGKFGPRTTSAVKKLQKRLGIEVTGKVTEDFIKQISDLHVLPPRPAAKRRPARKRVRRSMALHELENGICRTCQPHEHVLDNGICTTCGDAGPKGEASRHLPGLHDQSSHGRRFNTPGDPKSGIKKALKAAEKPSTEAKVEPKKAPVKRTPKPAAKKAPVKKVPTWEELGRPQGPSPVGQVIGHAGGTYERLPGEPRRYRVIAANGREISANVRTADDARIALRLDAADRERSEADAKSTWRKALGAISGSWSYDTREIEGFDAAAPQQRQAIRDALDRWTADKADNRDTSRLAEPRVNAALRGATPRTERVERDIRALDLAFTMSKTKRPITVYRGFSNGEHILPNDWQTRDLTGLEWSTKGFTPVSADDDVAEGYVGDVANRGFGIRLKLPKGSPAIAIPDAIGGLDNEGEIVLPRGLAFRVVKDNGAQGEYGNRWLDVEIVPAASP